MTRPEYRIIGDTHFGHDMMVKKGYRKDGFEEPILDQIAREMRPKDILIHVGDVAFYNTAYWHNRIMLACPVGTKKILIRGNHDRETLTKYYEYGWDAVVDELKLKIYGKTILFTHCPAHDMATGGDWRRTDFDINVHGHLHDDNHRWIGKLPDKQRLVYTTLVTLRKLIGI